MHLFTYGFSFSFITNKFYKRFRRLKHKWKITTMSMGLMRSQLRSEAPTWSWVKAITEGKKSCQDTAARYQTGQTRWTESIEMQPSQIKMLKFLFFPFLTLEPRPSRAFTHPVTPKMLMWTIHLILAPLRQPCLLSLHTQTVQKEIMIIKARAEFMVMAQCRVTRRIGFGSPVKPPYAPTRAHFRMWPVFSTSKFYNTVLPIGY